MPLSEKNREYFYKKVLALRKAIQALEGELEPKTLVPSKRKNKYREHVENTVALGIWRKPDFLKKKTKSCKLKDKCYLLRFLFGPFYNLPFSK